MAYKTLLRSQQVTAQFMIFIYKYLLIVKNFIVKYFCLRENVLWHFKYNCKKIKFGLGTLQVNGQFTKELIHICILCSLKTLHFQKKLNNNIFVYNKKKLFSVLNIIWSHTDKLHKHHFDIWKR